MANMPAEEEEVCCICHDPLPLGGLRAQHASGRAQHAASPLDYLRDPRSPRNRDRATSPIARQERQQACNAQAARLYTLGCGHQFHQGCIIPWLQYKRKCPICNQAAEVAAPELSDSILMGTSFQGSYHDPCEYHGQDFHQTGGNPLQRPVDLDYVLSASNGTHFSMGCMGSVPSMPDTGRNNGMVQDARNVFGSMGWNI